MPRVAINIACNSMHCSDCEKHTDLGDDRYCTLFTTEQYTAPGLIKIQSTILEWDSAENDYKRHPSCIAASVSY